MEIVWTYRAEDQLQNFDYLLKMSSIISDKAKYQIIEPYYMQGSNPDELG